MDAAARPRRKLLLALSLLGGLVLLVLALRAAGLRETASELGRVGPAGAALFLAVTMLALVGPTLGWHLLLRSEGIPTTLGLTFSSAVMGRGCNMVSPFMYFGGETIRTLHLAHALGIARSRVLAAIVVAEVEQLAALSLALAGACGVVAARRALPGTLVVWCVLGVFVLAAIAILSIALCVGKAGPAVRGLNLLIRLRLFPRTLASVRDAAREMESTVRRILTRRPGTLLASFLLTSLSPIVQALQPFLFWMLLGHAAAGRPRPDLPELAAFFVLIQLLFLIPVTPAGFGIYEGGMIGIFRLLGWPAHDGAAFGVLVRLDDLLYLLLGAALTIRYGAGAIIKRRAPVTIEADRPDPEGVAPAKGLVTQASQDGDVPA